MNYVVNPNRGPAGSTAAINRAAARWSNVATSSFQFIYKGKVTGGVHGADDGRNLISFGPFTKSDGTPDRDMLAENVYWYDVSTGRMFDSDIRFNTNFSWSVTTPALAGCYDVQNVATHELGHSVSLNDLYSIGAVNRTMYWACDVGETKKRTLDPDDVLGISALYP